MTPGASWRRIDWGAPVAAFVLGLVLRLLLVAISPELYSFDAFQRWAGRDHVLVQSWLPATQSVVWLVAKLGGDALTARLALSVVAAGAAAAGCVLAAGMGGRAAGWFFVVASTFGPFTVWGGSLYQEGTFLLVLFLGLSLALSGRATLGDLVIGAIGLVRYEGWPCVLLYLAWRRDPRALVALWGPGLWFVLHWGLGLRGFEASPIDFDDWMALDERFSLSDWLWDAGRLARLGWFTGAYGLGGAAILGAWVALRARTRGAILLLALTLAQVLATCGWLVGLEVATHRMLTIPTMLCAVLGSIGAAWAWNSYSRPWVRAGFALAIVAQTTVGLAEARREARSESWRTQPERTALRKMEHLPAKRWWIEPRRGLGTRDRHDGCEIFQGISALRHEADFLCALWLRREDDARAAEARETCDGSVIWNRDQDAYEVSSGPPPAAPSPSDPTPADPFVLGP